MAEEKVIIDIEIDNDGAIKATKDLTASIVDQTEEIKKTTSATKELEKTNKELEKENKRINEEIKKGNVDRAEGNKQLKANSQAIESNNAKIKQNKIEIIGQKDALTKTKAERKSAIKTIETESNSLNALRARNKELRKEQANVNLTTKEGQKRLKEINKEINKNDKAIKSNSDALSQQKQNIGNYKSAFEGLPGPIGMVQAGLKKILLNPVFALLAGLVLTLKLLKDAFSRSAEGQDLLAKGMGFLKGLLAVVERAFDRLAEVVIGAFENPKEAVKSLWEFIKSQFVNRITGLVDVFKGVFKLITGGFKNIKENAADLGQSLIQVTTGLDVEQQAKTWERLNGAIKEVNETVQKSIDLEQKRLNLRRSDIRAITQIARLESDILVARAEASNKLLEAEDRIKAIDRAEEAVRQKLDLQLNLAQRRLEVKRVENALAKTGLDDKEEEAQLEAEVIKLQGARATELRAFLKLRATTLDELADKEIKQIQSAAKANAESREETQRALVEGFTKLLASENLTARKRVDIEKLRADAVNAIAADTRKKQEALDKRNIKSVEERVKLETEIRQEALLEALRDTALFFKKSQEFIDENFRTTKEKLDADLEDEKITKEEHALALLEAQAEFNGATLELDQEFRETRAEIDQEDFEARKEQEDERFQEAKDLLKQQLDDNLITEEEHKKALEDLEKQHSDSILQIQKEKLANIEKLAKSSVDLVTGFIDAGARIRSDNLRVAQNKETTALNKQSQKELSDLQAKFDRGLISQTDFDIAKTALDEKFKEKEQNLARKQAFEQHNIDVKAFRAKKALQLIDIAIDMASTVIKAIAASPLTFGLPWSAINLAAQGTQFAVVAASNPPSPPSFAEGGQVIDGKPHSRGGENIFIGGKLVGNMQGGEGLFITKKEATAEALSLINQSYGGRGFSGKTHNSFFQEGGAAASISSLSPEVLQEAFAEALQNLPNPVVQVEDVQNGIDSREETLGVTVI